MATKTYDVTMYPATRDSAATWTCEASSIREAVRKFHAARSSAPKGAPEFPPAMRTYVRVRGGKRGYDVDGFGRNP